MEDEEREREREREREKERGEALKLCRGGSEKNTYLAYSSQFFRYLYLCISFSPPRPTPRIPKKMLCYFVVFGFQRRFFLTFYVSKEVESVFLLFFLV